MKWTSYVSGPRWAGWSRALRKLAVGIGADIAIISVENHCLGLRQTVFFTITGTDEQLTRARHSIRNTADDWNREG